LGKEFCEPDSGGQRNMEMSGSRQHRHGSAWTHVLFYHAYNARDSIYPGRQAMLDEVRWGANNWPTINDGKGPSVRAASPLGVPERNADYSFFDDFKAPRLLTSWQWPQSNEPVFHLQNERRRLTVAAINERKCQRYARRSAGAHDDGW
jgi:beta-xylosidase